MSLDRQLTAVESEENLKRNNSCSKFGEMETVNLLPSDGEAQVQVKESTATSNLPSHASVVFKNAIEASSPSDGSENVKDNGSTDGSKGPNLSQYFKENDAVKSQDFFLAYEKKDSTTGAQPDEEKEPFCDTAEQGDVSTNQPKLSKFFSDEKSGKDAVGKAFFDKISSVVGETPASSEPLNITVGRRISGNNSELCNLVLSQSPSQEIPFIGTGNSEDEIYEAWIPSESTQQILVSLTTAIPGTFYPSKENLTRPNVIIEEEIEDPLRALLYEVNSPLASQRKVLSANDVPQNEEGLKALMDANCYHAAINLTTRLLKSGYGVVGQAYMNPTILQIWFTRIALFVKLGKFSLAEVEGEAFGNLDKPDLYYEFYPDAYPDKKGSMVPFSFRLLLAQLPQYQGNHQVALNSLYSLLHVIRKIIQNFEKEFSDDGSMGTLPPNRKTAFLEVWKSREIRVLYSVLNCVLSQKDYVMAVSIANALMEKDSERIVQLYSALGKIYLQLGDMKQAQYCFTLVSNKAATSDDKNLHLEKLINNALLAVAHNDNEEAYKFYEKGLAIKPNDPMLVNNMAVCLLYMGRLKESLTLLEQTIQANPTTCLYEGILFNICTLYELESSHCTLKKHAMLDLVSKYVGDNFNVSCLKIPPNVKG